MTLDQVFMLLTDRNVLRKRRGRIVNIDPLQAAKMTKDGKIKGRAADGSIIYGRVGGKSLARQKMEEQAARAAADNSKKRRRRRNHGNRTS